MISALQFPPRSSGPTPWLWIGLIGVASILLSRAFACAMPFAALATFAAFTLSKRQALALVMFVWLADQLVGFGVLGYSWTFSHFAWGIAIGVAALACWIVAYGCARHLTFAHWVSLPLVLGAAYVTYELMLYATIWLLSAGPGAFTVSVILWIFAINGAALGLLIAAQRLAHMASVRLHGPSPTSS
jgi:hypothetical protein